MTEIEKIILMLAAHYPSSNITAANIAAYVEALKEVDPVALQRVVKQHVLASPFFPHVADLMRGLAAERLPLGAGLTPEEAWQFVASEVPSFYGASGETYQRANAAIGEFLHGILVSVGGWTAIQTRSSEDVRRAFVAKFKMAKDQIVTRATLAAAQDDSLALPDPEDQHPEIEE